MYIDKSLAVLQTIQLVQKALFSIQLLLIDHFTVRQYTQNGYKYTWRNI